MFMACVNARRLLKGLRLRSLEDCGAEWPGSCLGRLPEACSERLCEGSGGAAPLERLLRCGVKERRPLAI